MFDAVQAEIDYRQQQIAADWRPTSSRRWFRRRPAARGLGRTARESGTHAKQESFPRRVHDGLGSGAGEAAAGPAGT